MTQLNYKNQEKYVFTKKKFGKIGSWGHDLVVDTFLSYIVIYKVSLLVLKKIPDFFMVCANPT